MLARTIAFRARHLGADAARAGADLLVHSLADPVATKAALDALNVEVAGALALADLRLAAAYDVGRELVADTLSARGAGHRFEQRCSAAPGALCDAALVLVAPLLAPGAAAAVRGARREAFGRASNGSVLARAALAERLPLEVARWQRVLLGRAEVSTLGISDDTAPTEPAVLGARKRRRHLTAALAALFAVVAAVLALHTFVLETFVVPSGSMTPTIRAGDRVSADVLPFARDTIGRGDIVVFRRPPDDSGARAAYLVKRVIGLPGEQLASRGTTVLVDGRPLSEPWLAHLRGSCRTTALDLAPQRVPKGEYFLLGDCRGDSVDSRTYGDVPAADIVGKVDCVYWRDGHPVLDWI